MSPMAPRRVALAVVPVALALLVAACSESSQSSSDTLAGTGDSLAGTGVDVSTSTSTTEPTTTSSAQPSTTTTTPPTTSVTTTTTPPTTEPLPVRELVLRDDGIGAATFGAEPDGVIEYVSTLLGAPTGDTGWIDPFTFALCPGNEVRRVEWGVLSLLFSDDTPVSSGRRHFFAYEYGLDGQIGEEPQGLRTEGCSGRGSRVVDLRAEFPEVSVNQGEEGLFPSSFYVSDNFRGLLTGVNDDDLVTVIFGGYGCGE